MPDAELSGHASVAQRLHDTVASRERLAQANERALAAAERALAAHAASGATPPAAAAATTGAAARAITRSAAAAAAGRDAPARGSIAAMGVHASGQVGAVAAAMRAHGARVGMGELLAAQRALAAVDAADRSTVFFALRAALCSSRAEQALFAEAFAAVFGAGEQVDPFEELGEVTRQALPRIAVPPQGDEAPAAELTPAPAAWSEEELLREKDFAAYTDAERAAARQLLARIALRAPKRRSRRTVPTRRRRETHDLRATMRASLRHGGELLERRYREHAERPRRLVLICDVSGSMAPYSRMLLQYMQACVAARARVEAFVFGTRLTRVTRELRGRDADRALARASAAVTDWSGGTRIGEALSVLNREHGRRIGRGAVAILLSDGWDRGEPEQLADELARLGRTAHRVIWLNPLAADPRYEPLTRGMRAALPHVDRLLPGNSIASLDALADLLERGTA